MKKGIDKIWIFKLRYSRLELCIMLLMIGVTGCFLQIFGTSWDVTAHLLQQPETFFTPSHALLYTGIGLCIISAIIGLNLWYRNKEIQILSFAFSIKLLILGSILSLVAGPSDFLWHSIFGVDGLLSPTHLTLITGMLINSIAVVLGLARLTASVQTVTQMRIVKAALIPAFAAMWLTFIWYTYMFALPFSNGQHFNFNLNPIVEVLIAVVALPFISSIVFVTASKTIGTYGASTVVAILIAITTLTNIVPVTKLIPFLPWYFCIIIIAIAADLALNKTKRIVHLESKFWGIKKSVFVSGAMMGSIFYILGYPLLPYAFVEFFGYYDFLSISDALLIFINSVQTILPFTIIIGIIMGIIGSIVSEKKFNREKPRYNHTKDVM
jgi:hypothetical protein